LEPAAAVLALQNGILPPTANSSEPDPECNLDVIPNRARPAFAFGGLNAVLAFHRI
jgi:3-oxoacyl-(acyl-carrier-protein) synthase